jgi:hypothetical protein
MDYLWNDALQLYCIKQLRPINSMLKFHPPYYNDNSYKKLLDNKSKQPELQMMYDDIEKVKLFDLDMFANYRAGKHMYLDNSKIYLQAWAPSLSSETRLIIHINTIDDPYINYDHTDWDNRFYYLRFLRTYGYFDKFYNIVKSYKNNIYDGCFDCMLELFILGKFLLADKNWNMNHDTVADFIRSEPDKLFELIQTINSGLLYPSIKGVKCGMHGQITTPLKHLNLFTINHKQLYKISATTQTITPIKPEQYNLSLASNTKASHSAVNSIARLY